MLHNLYIVLGFTFNSNEDGHYNCYGTDREDIISHYYLNETDNKYYECNASCKTCENDKACI